ncbi:hypothetical protein WA158_003253 [Blastocystis sp. Blastoise]
MNVMDYIPYFFQVEKKRMNYLSFVTQKISNNKHASLFPRSFQCIYDGIKEDESLTMLLPIYKRIKSSQILPYLEKQTKKPDMIVILQNLHYIEFPKEVFLDRIIPTYYIWCSNWNSRYHGKTYFPSLFYTTLAMTSGYFLSVSKTRNLPTPPKYYRVDHSSIIEDIELCTTNSIECGTHCYVKGMKTHNSTRDLFRSNYTSIPIDLLPTYKQITPPDMSTLIKQITYYDSYSYYTSMGFIPYAYELSHLRPDITYNGKFCLDY